MIKKITAIFISTLATFLLLSAPVAAQTATAQACQDKAQDGISFFVDFPTWYKYLNFDDKCEVESFQLPGDLWKVGLALVEIVLRIAGLVAFGYTVFGGFKYVLSRGNPAEAAKARQTIIDAIIGIVIASISTVLISYIGRTLTR